MKINLKILGAILFVVNYTSGQSLLETLDKEYKASPTFELATFKTTRLGLGHSIETRSKGTLEISLYSRFWNHSEGETQRFLADEISNRFGLDYAVLDRLSLGIGYTNYDKATDGYFKFKLLRQQKGEGKLPLTITIVQTFSYRNFESAYNDLYPQNTILSSDVYSFASQLLLARKFSPKFSIQLSPTLLHRNRETLKGQPNTQFAAGLGVRYKIGGHVSIVSEYFQTFNKGEVNTTYSPFMLGVNWELSHLLLQFQVTNARGFVEDLFITQTQNNFNFHDGNFHFGFNATFVIQLKKNKL